MMAMAICLLTSAMMASAGDYTTYLTAARGFTEVTSTEDILADADYYYILTPAETTSLIVGIGTYKAKPDWASEETKALRYVAADSDPLLNLSNFFTIEKSGQYIGLRNVVYSADLFQTHDNAGYMYVNTYTDKTLDEWSYLTPTYQNDYWLFESGKYPISSGNWACGYLGPWNKTVAAGEALALNRQNTDDDAASHYRLFKIAKSDLMMAWSKLWQAASPTNKIDATWMITNPSFETGDERGWTLEGKDPNGNDEFKTRDYGMTNKDGQFLMNAFQWWASSLSVSQTVTGLPSGVYELSAVVATWAKRTVTFSGNETTINTAGINDGTGIPVAMDVTVSNKGKLTISAGSTGLWWIEGHEGETQTFFKLDDVRLRLKAAFLATVAQPLPNDNETTLIPDFWYYFDVPYSTDYWLIGELDGMTSSVDGGKLLSDITTSPVSRSMTLHKGRTYFKTSSSDATLRIIPKRSLIESEAFTAVALNVDGLPQKIATIELNPDGPGGDGTKKISQYLASKQYDFIGCSEDFNYHGSLISSLQDAYSWGAERATLSITDLPWSEIIRLKFRFDTDGLNLIWKKITCSATNESWAQWNSMVETDGNQYVKKGYRHYDMKIEGQTFDVYILHMDAGDTNATASRESQWQQLADAINSADASRPKLIIGDTNSRWTREDITTNFMNRLSSNFTASDVWVEFYRDGIYPTTDMADLTDQSDPTNYTNYEIVDKIIYINPTAANTTQLIPQSFKIEQDYTYDSVDHDGNTKALGDHKPVVVAFKYVTAGDVVTLNLDLPYDATDNSTTIRNASGATADVTLSGRTLYKDNSWNTLCLPFDMTAEQVTAQLAPEGLKTFSGSSFDSSSGTLTLDFADATSISAGTPYIIKWANGSDLVNPTFRGVTLSNATATVPTTYADFVGTYCPVNIYTDEKTNLYLGKENTLYYPTEAGFNVNAFHAYFHLKNGLTAGDPVTGSVKAFVLNVDGENHTGIIDAPSSAGDHQRDAWYDLSGRKLITTPTLGEGRGRLPRGIYLRNGRKVVVRSTQE